MASATIELFFYTIPVLGWKFSCGNFFRTVRIICNLYYFVVSRKITATKTEFPLTVYLFETPHTIWLRRPMDLAGFREAFIDGEYAWKPTITFVPQIIIDLGAHIGDTALYYHSLYPSAKIISVEASSDTFRRLEKNVFGISEIVPVHAAIGAVDSSIELFIDESSLGTSVINRSSSKLTESVRQITLASLMKEQGIDRADLIKFDIEGAECVLFSSLHPDEYADHYIGEFHFDLCEGSSERATAWFKSFAINFTPLTQGNRFLFTATKTQ